MNNQIYIEHLNVTFDGKFSLTFSETVKDVKDAKSYLIYLNNEAHEDIKKQFFSFTFPIYDDDFLNVRFNLDTNVVDEFFPLEDTLIHAFEKDLEYDRFKGFNKDCVKKRNQLNALLKEWGFTNDYFVLIYHSQDIGKEGKEIEIFSDFNELEKRISEIEKNIHPYEGEYILKLISPHNPKMNHEFSLFFNHKKERISTAFDTVKDFVIDIMKLRIRNGNREFVSLLEFWFDVYEETTEENSQDKEDYEPEMIDVQNIQGSFDYVFYHRHYVSMLLDCGKTKNVLNFEDWKKEVNKLFFPS